MTYTDCITQDSCGFIWFEFDGLSRYDGNQLKNWSMKPGDRNSLISNDLRCLVPDRKGNLWIGTQKGLSRFNTSTHQFTNYNYKFPNTVGIQFITTLCLADKGHFFIGTSNNGAYILDTENDSLVHFSTGSSEIARSLSSNSVYKILKAGENNYWVATESGLDLFRQDEATMQHFFSGKSVRDIAVDRNGGLWVSLYTNASFEIINEATGDPVRTVQMPDNFREKQKRLFFDSRDMLWISVLDRGLYIFDYGNLGQLKEVRDGSDVVPETISSPMNVYEDSFHNIWITTFNRGIYFYDRIESPFHIVKNRFSYNGRFATSTRVIYQDKENNIWAGARNAAILSRYNPKKNTFDNYVLQLPGDKKPEDDMIWSIIDYDHEKLLLSTLHSGLCIFNKGSHSFNFIQFDPNHTERLKSNSIYTLMEDRDGKLWIGYSDDGLDLYDPSSGLYSHYDMQDSSHSLSNNHVRTIYKDKSGIIWVGTTNGLNEYNPESDSFRSFFSDPDDKTTLTDSRVNAVYEDSRGILWVGTYLGLNRFDRATGKVKRYTAEDGYAFTNTFNILEDNDGCLWLNGERGLSRFNVDKESFDNYTDADGLQNTVYYHTASKLNSGELLFGGINGFNMFDPVNIKLQKRKLSVKITGIELFNKELQVGPDSPLKKDISQTDTVRFNYYDDVISLKYSALSFNNPDLITYAYRLKGFEPEWNEVGNRKTATYTNLKPGSYVFQVKASFNGLPTNAEYAELHIHISPPFWMTYWAFIAYAVILVLLVLLYRNLLIKRQIAKQKRELDEEKLQFFMNISHEFRTPLTIMINPLWDVMKNPDVSPGVKKVLDVAYRSAQKLMHLVNELQDFRKLDYNKDEMRLQKTEIVEYVKSNVEFFRSLADKKHITLIFEPGNDKLEAFTDTGKLDKILNNLISNALKYTGKGGLITIRVAKDKDSYDKTGNSDDLIFEVEDNGIGMSKQQVKDVFNRFYQVNSHNVGAGIGLNLVKRLVEQLSGTVSVESEPGKGSRFMIRIPFIKEYYYSENDFQRVQESQDKSVLDALEYDLDTLEADAFDKFNPESGKQTILIVEDNKTLLAQLKENLEINYNVITACNGEEGYNKAVKFEPNMVISDVMMPEMDGIELTEQLKTNEETCSIPVLLLTALSQVDDRIKAYETGADAYLSKPFYMTEVMVRVANMIENRERLVEQIKNRNLFTDLTSKDVKTKDEKFLDNVIGIITENLDKSDFSVSDLCSELRISSSSLFNKISLLTGQNPSGFIRTVRLKYSAELLLKGEDSVKEIGYRVGFNSHAYFSKSFSDYFGCSPTEYVKRHMR
ncbi:two-component regulator propeller domain-containing protein [Saccharicrinis sp. FJH62]|uniref:two-component regulator propeller domain-containing protein n=1 Tax=Saccharicrinis sp. FJH62 TaxID=3344657 RepID=UPI0035D46554